MENYKFYVEVGERINDDDYGFDVIDFHYFESTANTRREAFEALKSQMNSWVAENGYSGQKFDVQCSAV